MLNRTRMAVAAVLALRVASAAHAGGSRNDADPSGGYPVGPMGQIFGSGVNPVFHPDLFGKSEKVYDYLGFPHQQTRPRRKANNH
jgi:hypothetical protein